MTTVQIKTQQFTSTQVLGMTLRTKYPQHGTRNILTNQTGVIEKAGIGPHGLYLTIRRVDGTVRCLSTNRMIDPVIS